MASSCRNGQDNRLSPDYPDIDEELTKKALADMDIVVDWCKGQIEA